MSRPAESAVPVAETCRWRTGARSCSVRVYSQSHCSFHQYWLRLVDRGELARQQEEEFGEWWEQFQPYGRYAPTPGLWWADRAVLWAALSGRGEMPVATELIHRELYLRRVDVRRYLQQAAPVPPPWERVSGGPLPRWIPDEWQPKAVRWEQLIQSERWSRASSGAA